MPTLARLAAFVVLAGVCSTVSADNWPQWRGPAGDGRSSETELPVAWAENSGVVWRCPLPEWGDSTPAIWGDAVFVTTQVDDQKLMLLRIDKRTGRIVWTRQVGADSASPTGLFGKSGQQRRQQKFHESHNMASPSPVTDGQLVVVHFGNGDLAAYDFDGNRLWHRNLQKDHGRYSIWWGHANSPVLWENLVISVCMQDSCADLPGEPSPSYVVAHDMRTGREKWKTMRMTAATQESCDSYITPIFRDAGGRTELIVFGGQMLDAYDPATGRRLWWLPGLTGNRTISGPVAAHGLIYAVQGMRKPLVAVRPSGAGELTKKDVAWTFERPTPDSPSPVVCGDLLVFVTNDGAARCLDARTGRLHWKERLKGDYRASPVAADGRVYFLNTKGLATVVAASRGFDRLTENQLDDETLASPAISDGRLFIRGRKALYCVGK